MLPVFAVLGFLKGNYEKILLGAIVLVTGILIAALWAGKKHFENKFHSEVASHAETKSAHNLAVAEAALQTAKAERAERDKEQAAQAAANRERIKDEDNERKWQARVVELTGRDGARRKQLLDHIGRLTNHISTSETSKNPSGTIVDLQNRLATCGQFLGRADDIAERAAVGYGQARNAWDECARDAKIVRGEGLGATQ